MLDRQLDVALRSLAAQQHQLLTRAQARDVGASPTQLRARLASPAWEEPTRRVLRLVGSPATFKQRCMAAALDAGARAVVSHQAAAALWGLPGFRRAELVVSRPRGGTRRPSALAVVHEPRLLAVTHVAVLDGIPITTPARTVFDLAACCHPGRVERALDNGWSRGLVAPRAISELVKELCRQGRPGSTLMRLLMLEREWDYVPPASGLEARFLSVVAAANLPLPRRQVDVGAGCWVGRVDFLYPEHKLVIEIDSVRYHSSKLDTGADAARDQALRAAGFEVLRISEDLIWSQPAEVVRILAAALRMAA